MYFGEKYKDNFTVTKILTPVGKDAENYIYNIGYLHRNGPRKTTFCNKAYSCIYVFSGTGTYIDDKTGKQYDIVPGCVVQRLPDTVHTHIINKGDVWSEFYFCAGAKLFNTLKELGHISSEPVFYVGEDETIHKNLIKYSELIQNTDIYNNDKIIPEFVKLITFINSCRNNYFYDKWAFDTANIIRHNINVGISLEEIAHKCNMSYENLRKKFSKVFGCSIKDYIIHIRIEEAKNMLINDEMSVGEVAFKLGYCDSFAFCKQFRNITGMYPAKFVSSFGDNRYLYEK